jgi:hypothetical protein
MTSMATVSKGAIVVSWGSTIPGREKKMLEVLGEVLQYSRKLEEAGRIEETRVFVTTAGPNRDTLMLFGALEQLAPILVDDEFESHLQDGMLVVQDVNVALWAGGRPEELLSGLALHTEKLTDHGLL